MKGRESNVPGAAPRLTIAVPTYNRARILDLCLSRIAVQLKGREDQVELIVANNCSTDGTDAVVEKHLAAGVPIRYLRRERNIGGDANFASCFRAAKGKYVLIFSDDDVLLDGALETILEALEEEYGVVFLKSHSYLYDYIAERPKRQPPVRTPNLVRYDDTMEYVKKINVMFTFLSGNVVNKSLVDVDLDIDDFIGTGLVHLSWTFSALFKARRNLYIDTLMLAARAEHSGYSLCEVFGVNQNRIFDVFSRKGVDPCYFQEINRRILRNFFPGHIIKMREGSGGFSRENYYDILHPVFKSYPCFWLATYPAIVLPIPLAKAWRKICKKYFKIFRMI